MIKPAALILAASALLLFLKRSPRRLTNPASPGRLRNCDAWGCGYFGASRSNGTRTHKGLDILAEPGDPIKAPISGTLTREARPYSSGSLSGFEIVNGKEKVKIFYALPNFGKIGSKVKAGEKVATAQRMNTQYPGMQNHIHLEHIINGKHIAPKI